jgi:hypothetical protein
MEVISLNAVRYRLCFTLDVKHSFKTSSLQFHFHFWKTKRNHEVLRSVVGWMGSGNFFLFFVVSHKLCGFQ